MSSRFSLKLVLLGEGEKKGGLDRGDRNMKDLVSSSGVAGRKRIVARGESVCMVCTGFECRGDAAKIPKN